MNKAKGDNGLVPSLRFQGFDEAWEQSLIGNQQLFSLHKGKGIAKDDIALNGITQCIRYGELYTHYNEVIDTVISKTNYPVSELFLSKEKDVIIPSSGETKLDIAKASCVLHANIALGSDLNIIRTKLNGVFFSYYLNGSKRYEIAKVAQGDSVVHLYMSQLKKISIDFPSPSEQSKIASFLSSLDDLIALEGEKLLSLKTHKKGLMQQLFPANGVTTPTLRFQGFHGAWEETKIGEVCDLYQPETITSSELSFKGAFTVYGANGIIGKYDKFNHLESEVIVTCRGATCGEVHKTKEKSWITGNAMVVSAKKDFFTKPFLYELLRFDGLKSVISGSAQPQITRAGFSPLIIKFPKIPEQTKIASLLSSFDDLITAQGEKIDTLKTLKKGLMQQLFPRLERSAS